MFMADGINPVVYLKKHPEGCSSAVPDKGQGALASFSQQETPFMVSG
jgi:hypothetical protein